MSKQKKDKKKRPLWRRVLRRLILIITVFIVVSVLFLAGVGEYYMRSVTNIYYAQFPDVYYSQIIADVTVDGRDYQLSATARCSVVTKADSTLLKVSDFPASLTIEGGVIGKRLPSGAGLLIRGHAFCGGVALGESRDQNAPGKLSDFDLERYLNIKSKVAVVWLDNADTPTVVEKYFTTGYFSHPKARVKLHKLSYRVIEEQPVTDPSSEIGWLRGRFPLQTQDYRKSDWVGFVAHTLGEESWSRHPYFVDILSGRTNPDWVKVRWPGDADFQIDDWVDWPVDIDPAAMEMAISLNSDQPSGYTVLHAMGSYQKIPYRDNLKLLIGRKQLRPRPIGGDFMVFEPESQRLVTRFDHVTVNRSDFLWWRTEADTSPVAQGGHPHSIRDGGKRSDEDKGLCKQGKRYYPYPCLVPARLGDQYLLVPANYLNEILSYSMPLSRRDGMFLIALMPDYAQRTDANEDIFHNPTKDYPRIYGFLQPYNEKYSKKRRADVLGFLLYVQHELAEQVIKTDDLHGLTREISSDKIHDEDILFRQIDGKVETFITCAPFDIHAFKVPFCNHYIDLPRLRATIEIRYHKKYLPQWRETEVRFRDLLHSFASTKGEIHSLPRN